MSLFSWQGQNLLVFINYWRVVLHLKDVLYIIESQYISISVNCRCKYALEDFTSLSWSQLPPDVDDERVFPGFKLEDILPFGSCHDPIRSLFLFTTWTDLPEDIITDRSGQCGIFNFLWYNIHMCEKIVSKSNPN